MSPQFVDFDGDGNIDIVAGIFDGSPKLARGDGETWAQPQWILDRNGDRIVLNSYWNFDKKQWVETDRCDPEGGVPGRGHLTSAIAFDWDGDGDWDLLLGDHVSGYVYLRRNEGSNEAPAFATHNEVVTAGGKPMHEPGTVATLRSVDWNRDGRLDLMVSGMGTDIGGNVVVYLDHNDSGEPRFEQPLVLIERGKQDLADKPKRPDIGLHPEPVDFDGDGDLDLIVGGYSIWSPPERELSDAEKQELADTREKAAELQKQVAELNRKMLHATTGLDSDAAREKRMEMAKDPERTKVFTAYYAANKRITELDPPPQRVSFTWLYENLATAPDTGNR